jgi:branched-chain amino acid transport system permease protein
VAILQAKLGVPAWLGLAAAPVVGGLGALAIGWLSVRVTGMYFAMLTLAFGQLVFTIVLGWYSFTGGDDGLPVALPDWMLSAHNYYYFCLGVVTVCLWLIHRVTRSPFGAALGAIRDNRQRAAYIGLDVRRIELRVFVVAGAFAGVAGGLRAPLQQMAFPSLLDWAQSADPVLMSLAGGIHTFLGPIVGAAVFVFTNFVVTSHFEYPLLVFGLIVLFIVLFLPDGIVGSLSRWQRRTRKTSPGPRP